LNLSRLEITGFKSFAGRSVLDFDKGKNIAAIVGPNGSGKSNVADAIRWVLGEQSYKTLRSKKSEDVIFSGSGGKAKGSMAKVSMVLDNSDGKAAIDFSEVQISRTVYRDGTGEYMIAGKKARLMDVAELLARSGFGQSTYSVIGQGMVDSMLFYGPAERKVLFDEAAGVRQYELKREQTIKKLEDTTGNVIRIKDILSELNPRLNTLKRQAEKAKEKDAVSADLLDKQKVYFSTIWDKISQLEKEKRSELDKLTAEESKVQAEIDTLNTQFGEILNTEKSDGSESRELESKILELEDAKDAVRQKIFTLRTKLELSASSMTKKEIDNQIVEAKKRLKEITLDEKQSKLDKLSEKLEENSRPKIQATIVDLENQKDSLRQEIYTLRAKMEAQENSLSREDIEGKIESLTLEMDTLDSHSALNQKNQHHKEVDKIQAELQKIEKTISQKKQKLAALQEEFSSFDFGTVSERVGAILYLQNDFVIQIEAAKDMASVKSALETGKKIAERLKELRKQVGDVKDGRISGITDLQKDLESLTGQKENYVAEVNRHNSEVWKLEFELKKIEDKKFEIEKEIGKLSTQKPADDKELKNVESVIAQKQTAISGLDTQIDELKNEIEAIAGEQSIKMSLEYEIKREQEKKKDIEDEIARLMGLKPAEESERKQIESDIEGHQKEVAKLDSQISTIRAEVNKKSQDFNTQSKRLTEIKDNLAGKQHLVTEYTNAISNLRVELARFETKKQDIREDIVHDLGSESVLAGAHIVPELDEALAKAEIEKLRNKLFTIGEIDSEVETEYEEVSKRVEFMSTQNDDLEKAKDDLEKLISDLDVKIKKQFEGSFSAISAKFSHFFEILFEGGSAKLELVHTKDEEDDKEQFGIEITAVPPGKRVQNLSALSGGERTMTSLALLFAILSVNPAPFCVLDEVDAALDESNTKRFLKIVEELSKNTQFIFITHNRETMKPANIIYGVTMDETHASRLLSVRLEDALATAKK
jgi:chromosome segregation protein